MSYRKFVCATPTLSMVFEIGANLKRHCLCKWKIARLFTPTNVPLQDWEQVSHFIRAIEEQFFTKIEYMTISVSRFSSFVWYINSRHLPQGAKIEIFSSLSFQSCSLLIWYTLFTDENCDQSIFLGQFIPRWTLIPLNKLWKDSIVEREGSSCKENFLNKQNTQGKIHWEGRILGPTEWTDAVYR